MNPTDEQESILGLLTRTEDNILINALAGTGKTTTLELMQAAIKPPVLCLAFNRDIADRMKQTFADTTLVKTFNGLGHGIWMKTVSSVALDKRKIADLLKDEINEIKGKDRAEAREVYWDILSAVGLAKSLGYIPHGKYNHARRLITEEAFYDALETKATPFVRSIIDSILIQSIKLAYKGCIDFNDQVYMPALFGGTFPRFPTVLVDEYQDLSPVNHAMLDKLVRGRLCAVGDRWQSIYGFRGAETQGVEKLNARFGMTGRDLSVSFRCPRAVVEAARWRVPHFKWIKDGGRYETLDVLPAHDIPEGATIICRNNAPLFRLGLKLLSAKRSVQISGSEVGPKIIKLLSKVGVEEDSTEDLMIKIEGWKIEKLATTQAPQTIHDTAECMKVFAAFGKTLRSAVAYAEHLFKQQGTITLTTGHKAKGKEWDIVYHLDPWLIGKGDQEDNLRYVIQTRAKSEAYEIESRRITW